MKTGTGKEKGFTLVELLFTMLLFPFLFLSIYGLVTMANVIFSVNDLSSRLNQDSMQTLRYISREIGQTSPLISPRHLMITTDGNGNSIVRFQIPIDWDNDGDVVTADLNPTTEWGAYQAVGVSQNGILGGWIRYQVVNNQLIRETLDATLTPINDSTRIVASHVNQFTVTQDPNATDVLVMTLALTGTDNLGQNGRERILNSTFSSRTFLRNSVS